MAMTQDGVAYLLNGAFRRMEYTEWGDKSRPVVVCVHGLTRTGRDFDTLAEALSDQYYLVCPDLPGRGASDWLPSGMLYQPATYVIALGHLLAKLGREVRWIGTSLGGICGMAVAAAEGTPITRMVLNDVGPFIPKVALERIRDYVAANEPPVFDDVAGVEAYLRRVHAPFGPLTDAQWAHLGRTSARTVEDGKVMLHYDPKIAEPIKVTEPADLDMWALWRPQIPTLGIRGETSDLLEPGTLKRMAETGAEVYEVPDTGHAPALMDAPAIERIRAFLAG
jgi:pimeloyl-ACP methyl ester carboxylesterase